LARGPGLLDDPLLRHRHLLERKFHPEITAGHHHPVEGLDHLRQRLDGLGLLDLRDQREPDPHLVHDPAGLDRVLGALDEGQRDHVGLQAECPAQVCLVFGGQGGHADLDARQVEALVVGDDAAHDDPGADPAPGHVEHLQDDPAVVHQDPVARLHVVGQARVGRAHFVLVPRHLVHGDGEVLAGQQPDRPGRERAQPDLRALQVDEHPDAVPGRIGRGPDTLVGGEVASLGAMTHIQPGHVDPGRDEFGEPLRAG
jgi:hypothetical protein